MKDLIETLEEYANGFINVIAPPEEDVKELLEHIYNQDKEIERLNNIINELEEELERESNMKEEDTCLEHNTFIDIKNTLKTVLKRLQELKGSDSNE